MVYDCFNFFNEFDLLEIRLNELDEVVDYFVLCEANLTLLGNPKPMYYEENKERFKKFKDKIIYLPMKVNKGSYIRTGKGSQKSFVKNGLTNCNDDDIIIYSDIDEIPMRNKIEEGIKELKNNNLVCFAGYNIMYYLNGVKYMNNKKDIWYGSIMSTYGHIKNKDIWAQRKDRIKNATILYESGWHFTSVGDIDHLLLKFKSFGHAVDNAKFINESPDPHTLLNGFIENGIDCFKKERKIKYETDLNFLPQHIQANKKHFKHLIK